MTHPTNTVLTKEEIAAVYRQWLDAPESENEYDLIARAARAVVEKLGTSSERPVMLLSSVREYLQEGIESATGGNDDDVDMDFANQLVILLHKPLYDATALAQAHQQGRNEGRNEGREEARAEFGPDAERYRWFATHQASSSWREDSFAVIGVSIPKPPGGHIPTMTPEELSEAIDAARQPTQKDD